MHIEEVVLPGGHILMARVGDDCPTCGAEMFHAGFYGEVCPNYCNEKNKNVNAVRGNEESKPGVFARANS